MPLALKATIIPGCYEVLSHVAMDGRGSFVKPFARSFFQSQGLRSNWVESYYSTSRRGVLRGMHFQVPPHEHAKLVYCVEGEVLDVALDLREGSPTFRQHMGLRLSAEARNALYLDVGLAHGFLTMSSTATLVYCVTSEYSTTHDSGVRWDSAGIPWPDATPEVSERDRALAPMHAFRSPFRFDARSQDKLEDG